MWRNFCEALEERFTDKQKRFRDSRALMALKYEGDIQVFLTEFERLNDTVGLSGGILQGQIMEAVPPVVLDMLFASNGEIPLEDEAMFQAFEEAALIFE